MKKHILNLVACAAFSMSLFSSCDTDAEGVLYESDKTEYAFASTMQKTELLPSDGNKVIVPIYRNTTAGTSTVNVSLEAADNAEGIFALENQTVTFEEGKAEANVVVTYNDINELSAAAVYSFVLSFDEADASPSQYNSIKVSAQRKLTFKEIGTGIFGTTFFGNEDGSPYLMKIAVEKAEEANVYRMLDVYEESFHLTFATDENGEVISFDDQETGYVHPSYGMISVQFNGAKKEGNTYTFLLKFYCSAGSFGSFYETIEMPN